MTNGYIKFSNGKEIRWHNSRPRNELFYVLRKIIKKHEKEKSFRIDDYLPTKIVRLKKLKQLRKIKQ